MPAGSHEPPPHHGIVLAVGPGVDWWEAQGVAMPVAEYLQVSQTYQKDGKFLFYLMQHSTTELLLPSSNQKPVNLADKSADEIVRRLLDMTRR